MEDKDYLLLQYLSQFDSPIKLEEKDVPDDIKANFQFIGLDRYKYPNSIYVRLFDLEKNKLVYSRYSRMYQITDLGRTELKNHQERNAPKVFAKLCDTVLRFINDGDKKDISYNTLDISEALNFDYDTVEIIAEEFEQRGLIKLSTTNGHYNFHVMPTAHSFAKKTSFAFEKEKELSVGGIYNSFNTTTSNTTHGANSPIASEHSKNEQTFNPEPKAPEKKKWWKALFEWLWEQVKKPLVTAISSAIVGFFTGRATKTEQPQLNNQKQSQTTNKQNTKDTSFNNLNVQ